MKPNVILFDLDGTLTDPFTGITESVRYALVCMGIDPPPAAELADFIGPPLSEGFQTHFGMNLQQAEQAIAFYRERFSRIGLFENEVYTGVPGMLGDLKSAGYSLVLATSKPTVFAQKILERFDLMRYFDLAIGSELDGSVVKKADVIAEALALCSGKSAEEANAIAKMPRTPSGRYRTDAYMVGDRRFDVEGAAKNDLNCLGVLYGYGSLEELQQSGASAVAKTPNEVVAFFLNLKNK